MAAKMKNISQAEVLVLKEQISYQEGQVVSKTLAQNSAVSITLFSFSKGEEISTHKSGGDAFVAPLPGRPHLLYGLERRGQDERPVRGHRDENAALSHRVLSRRPQPVR